MSELMKSLAGLMWALQWVKAPEVSSRKLLVEESQLDSQRHCMD